MNIFSDYAKYYDVQYAAKNYENEVAYILAVAKKYGSDPKTLLDIGCGTGGHLIPFYHHGLKVRGFDLSERMVSAAKRKLEQMNIDDVVIDIGDATMYRNGESYDLVVSMFAVMGYLTTNSNFLDGLRTAYAHLNENGLFIFDVWNGSAVLNEKPSQRVNYYSVGTETIMRIATPSLDIYNHVVHVSYHIIKRKDNIVIEEVKEIHTMRYFFVQELSYYLQSAGMELIGAFPFLALNGQPSISDWNMTIVAKKV